MALTGPTTSRFVCARLTSGLLCQTVHPAQVDPTELGPGQHVHRTRHLNIPSPARLPACPYLGVHTDVLAGLQPEQTACGAGLDDALACQQRDGAQANSTRLDLLEIVQSLNGPDLTAHSNMYHQFPGTFDLMLSGSCFTWLICTCSPRIFVALAAFSCF